MSKRTVVIVVLTLVVGLIVGIVIGRGFRKDDHTGHSMTEAAAGAAEPAIKFWTCSMHPQIKQPGTGKCPICAMDLIPVHEDEGDEPLGPREIKLSPTAQKLAGVMTVPAERKPVTTEVRLVGKVEYDETKLAYITAWVPGRLDRLYVDYTGVPVNKGDHLVYLYSPELLAAQEELIQSLITVENLQANGGSMIRERAVATIDASREKLRLWGLTAGQIKNIAKSGKPEDHLTIYAPVSGIVVQKHALEGQYVQTGSRIYTIADLAQVWVKLDAYESHLPWIHYGQEVAFETEAYPGEVFKGRIAFIDPVLDPKTRTVKVRVNVPNPDGRLKPEMFVRAVVSSRAAAEGKIIDPELADKYVCPMHPEVVKEGAGICDICEMDLMSAKALGYVSAAASKVETPVVIPATAPLITGKRAVVYVAVSGREGVFEGREVVLGPRAGDQYIVRDGLEEGEQVVMQGAFKIDSAIQIQAKPSMMTMSPQIEVPVLSQEQLDGLIATYFTVQKALASDKFAAAKEAAALFTDTGNQAFDKVIRRVADAKDVETARAAFAPLSVALREAIKAAKRVPDPPVYVLHCPMALDNKGADWLQADEDTRNPYFGAAMLKCGGVKETIE